LLENIENHRYSKILKQRENNSVLISNLEGLKIRIPGTCFSTNQKIDKLIDAKNAKQDHDNTWYENDYADLARIKITFDKKMSNVKNNSIWSRP